MLPWAIAATRNKTNVAAIAVIDALLGWTVIGWVAALVMACTSEPSQSGVMIVNTQMVQNTQAPMQPQMGYQQPGQEQLGYQQHAQPHYYGQPALRQPYGQAALPTYGHSRSDQDYPSGGYQNRDYQTGQYNDHESAQYEPIAATPWPGPHSSTLHNPGDLR